MATDLVEITAVVFLILGYMANLIVRAILIYLDWQSGEKINWWMQGLYIFGVPAALIFATMEILVILGFLSEKTACSIFLRWLNKLFIAKIV